MQIAVSSMLVLTGICVYAAINHLSVALRRPIDRTNLLFAGMCLSLVGFGLSQVQTYQAQTLAEYILALKWNITFIIGMFVLFPWFIADFTGIRPRPLLIIFTITFAVLPFFNLGQPYSIQYDAVTRLGYLYLPWGETVAQAVGHNSTLFYIVASLVLANIGYSLYALIMSWRRDQSFTTLVILLAVGLTLVVTIEGILVRSGVINFLHLGPFGFLLMIIIISVAFNLDTRQRLTASERRFRSLVEQSPFSIQVLTPDGYTQQVNPAWEKLWGVKAQAISGYNILRDDQLSTLGVIPYLERGIAGEATEIPPVVYNPAHNPEVRGPTRDRWIRAYIYPIRDETDAIREAILMHEDVTEKKHIEDAIRLIASGVSAETGERFFQQLVQSLANLFKADFAFIGLIDNNEDQKVKSIAVSAYGQTAPDMSYSLVGTPCASVLEQRTCAYPKEVRRLFPDDQLLAEMEAEGFIGAPLFDADGSRVGLIAVIDSKPLENIRQVQEILEIFAARAGAEVQRLRAEAHIRHMAYQDYLTGLASRAHLHERLQEMLHQAHATGERGALMLIDLDHFKTINDALGHDVGDEVLQAVARQLSDTVAEHAFVARVGGDEFVALTSTGSRDSNEAENTAHALASRIMETLSSPVVIGDRSFSVGASIGVVMFPDNSETELDIMRHADMALYNAKNLGRGLIQFYLPSLQESATNRLQIEEGLRRVIDNRELELHLQAQVDGNGRMIGAEVLLRWRHPQRGDIPPSAFIPVAEETGLIHEIGGWVLKQSCGYLGHWLHGGEPFRGHLSVNVSPWQFARPDFLQQVDQALEVSQVNARHLMLELTETALLYDLNEAIRKLNALRTLGIRVALDDFGTGYSSLAFLRDLPLDQIKIDKAFVSELDHAIEQPLVESMISIGEHMKLTVIAEGVENEAQYAKLNKMGCRGFQGYLFCRPLPENEFLLWMRENHQRFASDKN